MDVFERLYHAAKTKEAKKAALRKKLWKAEVETYNNFQVCWALSSGQDDSGQRSWRGYLSSDMTASIEGLKIVALD